MRRRVARRDFLQISDAAAATGGSAGILATGRAPACALNDWPQLYADSVVDVSDIANESGSVQGGFHETSKFVASDGQKRIAVRWCIVGVALTNRKSWFADSGYADGNAPGTWESCIAAGRKMKATGRPLGQTPGHMSGDAPAFRYPFLWAWGGKKVEADGKTVVLNSPSTVDSVKFAVSAWKDAYEAGGLAWDDSSNNRAFLSGAEASTLNGASIYLEAKRKHDSYRTADGKPLKDDFFHSVLPKGSARQFSCHMPFSDMLMGYSKTQKATNFLRWIGSPQVYALWFESQQGFSVGAITDWENRRSGTRTRSGGPIILRREPAALPAMPDRPHAARPKPSRDTFLSVWMRKRSRARRPRTRSNGRMSSS